MSDIEQGVNHETVQTDASKETEAVKANEKVSKQPVKHEEFHDCFYMTKDGEPDAVVNENSVEIMKEQGWKLKMAKPSK